VNAATCLNVNGDGLVMYDSDQACVRLIA
jgi:hypothetical protein